MHASEWTRIDSSLTLPTDATDKADTEDTAGDKLTQEFASGLRFPERPIALGAGSLLVVEITAGRLTHIGRGGLKRTVAELGGGPCGAALGPDGRTGRQPAYVTLSSTGRIAALQSRYAGAATNFEHPGNLKETP